MSEARSETENPSPQPPSESATSGGEVEGGEGKADPGDATRDASPGRPHIQCCICLALIPLSDYRTARCWVDPEGTTCAAHANCLIRIGDWEVLI